MQVSPRLYEPCPIKARTQHQVVSVRPSMTRTQKEKRRDRFRKGLSASITEPYRPLGTPDLTLDKPLYTTGSYRTNMTLLPNKKIRNQGFHDQKDTNMQNSNDETHALARMCSISSQVLLKSARSPRRDPSLHLLKSHMVESERRVKEMKAGAHIWEVSGTRAFPHPPAKNKSPERFRGDFIFQQREAVSRAIYLPYASRCPQKPPIVLPTIEEFKERYYDEIFRNAAPGSNTSLGVHTGLVRMESRLALSHVESRTLLNDFSTYDLQDNFFSARSMQQSQEQVQTTEKSEDMSYIDMFDPLIQVNRHCKDFDETIQKKYINLQQILDVMQRERHDTMNRKMKAFKLHGSSSHQFLEKDMQVMRLEAETERLEEYRDAAKQSQWYHKMLAHLLSNNAEISPVELFIVTYVQRVIEEGFVFDPKILFSLVDSLSVHELKIYEVERLLSFIRKESGVSLEEWQKYFEENNLPIPAEVLERQRELKVKAALALAGSVQINRRTSVDVAQQTNTGVHSESRSRIQSRLRSFLQSQTSQTSLSSLNSRDSDQNTRKSEFKDSFRLPGISKVHTNRSVLPSIPYSPIEEDESLSSPVPEESSNHFVRLAEAP